ncbi:MAG TPA: putative Ig domain-containing protein [Pirellulaceae bacterium]|nr:putative Ig domain-containing protein [Pirellulaceae bacterium]
MDWGGGNYHLGLPDGTAVFSSVPRTSGWHQFTIDAKADSIRYLIDGSEVFSGVAVAPIARVALAMYGPSWRPSWVTYFDDFEFAPAAQQPSRPPNNVTVHVDDGRGGFDTQSFTIDVLGNRPPEIVSQPVTDAFAGHPYVYDVEAVDLDGDTLSFALTQSPTGMGIDPAQGLISWTPAAFGSISEFGIPTPNSRPYGITTGPDGHIWFTEEAGNKIGRMTVDGVVTNEYTVPTPGIQPEGITVGPDGNLWFAEVGGKIGRLTPAGVFTEFPVPSPGRSPRLITAGPDGNLWYSQLGTTGTIGRITPSGVITEFFVGGQTTGITAGPDGNIWFSEYAGETIGRITPSGVVTKFAVPGAVTGDLIEITVGPDGNLWFTQLASKKIGRITPAGVITQFDLPTGSGAYGITSGPDGNLWFTGNHKLGRITPGGVITAFDIPTPSSSPALITTGPDGNIWFTEFGNNINKIGRVNIADSAPVTVRVDDGRGGFDTQSFAIDVSTAAPGEIHGTKFNDHDGDGVQDTPHLRAAWLFNDETLTGIGPNSTTGVVVERQGLAPDFVSGVHEGKGLRFRVVADNEPNDTVVFPGTKEQLSLGAEPFTIVAWIRSDIPTNARYLITQDSSGSGDGFALFHNRGLKSLRFNQSSDGTFIQRDSDSDPSDSAFHAWALVREADGTVRFYRDGAPAETIAPGPLLNLKNYRDLTLVDWFVPNGDPDIGEVVLDDIAFFRGGLSDIQIQRIADGGLESFLRDGLETGLQNWTIYIDQNQNGVRDPGERFTITDANGDYSFTNLAPGTYYVVEEQHQGWEQTAPASRTWEVTVGSGQVVTGIDFGNRQTDEPPVEQPNRAPVFTSTPDGSATIGQLFRYDAQATDPDADTLTFDLVVKPAGMAVDPARGIVVWVPTADQAGTHEVTLRVQDGRGGVALQSFAVTASRANSTPVITSLPKGPAVVALPWQYQVAAQDADGDVITFDLDESPAGMTIDAATGLVTWTPAAGQVGDQHVAVRASDGRGASTTQSFDLPVVATAPNDPPTITSSPRGRVRIGDVYLYQTIASDPNGDPLTFSLPIAPAGMTIDATGLVTWQPTAEQLGSHQVQVRVEDGRGGFATQTWSVSVVTQTSNQPPSITSTPPQAATVGRQYAYDAAATDPDGDPLTWSLDTAPAGMSIDPARGTIRWVPTSDQTGEQSVVVRATDTQGGWATQSFSIITRAVNLPPAINSTPPTTAVVAQLYTYAVRATDPESDPLTFSLTTAPAGMTIDSASGLISWTPTAAQSGSFAVGIQVTDGQGGLATQSYTLVASATATNQPPVITSSPPLVATVAQAYEYAVTAAEPEGQTVLFSLLTAPAGMTIDPTTGLVEWTPAADQIGLASVTVAAIDPAGNGGTQSFTIDVADNNSPPAISSTPSQVVTAGLAYRYDVRASDPDGDALAFRLDAAPAGMTIDQLGRVTWSPQIADIGTHSIAVTVEDPRGAAQTQTYDLVVAPDGQTPRVNLQLSANPVEVGSLVTFVATATDNVGVTSLVLSIDGNPVPLDANGRITLRAEPAGNYEIRVAASDAAGNTGLATTTLFVIDTSDVNAPTVEISSPSDGTIVTAPVDVLGTAADDNLVFYTLSAAPLGSDTFTELFRATTPVTNGLLGKFDPSGLANGTYRLRLTAQDAGGNVSYIENVIDVAGNLKIGNFTLSFTDLTVPVSGIPISVSRTYDTLQAGLQDELGFGWRLEFRDTDLRTSVQPTSEFEQEIGIFTPYHQGARVYVTLPGGRREGFSFMPRRTSGFGGTLFFEPEFVADPGVTSRLSVTPATLIIGSDGLFYGANSLAYNPADKLNFGGEFFLTTKDGVAYAIDANTGDLNTLSDASGNQLTFTDAAIESNRGPRVTFQRDPQGRIIGVTDPLGNQVRYQYDARGDLVSVTDRDGNVTRFVYGEPTRAHYLTEVIDPLGRSGVRTEYDDQGRLVRLIDADGNPVQLVHDPDNFVETVIDALGRPTLFEYDLAGNVVTEVDALGGITRRTYDAANNLLTETDPLGNVTRFSYDGDGNLLTETDPLGNVTRFTYQSVTPGYFDRVRGARPVALLASSTDPLGNTTVNTYAGTNLASTRDAAGNETRFAYDGAGNQTSITDAAGQITRFEYDAAGNLTRQVDALQNATQFTYDTAGNQLTETRTLTTPAGSRTLVTRTDYDDSGRPIAVTDAEGNTTRTEYDELGNQRATIDALLRRTDFIYDERGQLVEMRFADGTKSTTEYDAAGRRIASTGRGGETTHFEYDALGRLTATIFPDATPLNPDDNSRTRTEYDAAGRVRAQIDERGNRTEFEYDLVGRQTLVRDALLHETTTEYDAAGRSVAVTDALARTTQFVYDALGRQVETRFADGTTRQTDYDPLGRVIAETDQAGRVTQFEYDSLGRLTAVVDALSQRTEYGYDEAGNLVTQKDANEHVTRYEYDGLGRRIATQLPLGQRSSTAYDAVGDVANATDFNGDTIEYEYDENSRHLAKLFPDGTSVSFTYTPSGQRETYVDARGTTSWEYDERQRLVRRTDPDGTAIEYTYDVAGNRTSVSTPAGTIAYAFDALNRLSSVTDPQGGLTDYTYDAAGQLVRTDLPNGTWETREYDAVGRLEFLENRSTSDTISSYRYTLSPTGRRDAVVEHDGRRVDYFYDDLDRLTGEQITDALLGNRSIGYTYDPVGNRLTRSDSGEGTTGYTYDANDRLLTESLGGSTTNYTYDDNGNTLSRVASAVDQVFYEWDFENRLVGAEVTDAAGTRQIDYAYDADGIRVSSTVADSETRYLIDTSHPFQQVAVEYTPGGIIQASYVHGLDLISQTRPSTGRSFYHVDGLGSTRALTNALAAVTDRYLYDAFGRTIGQVGSTENVYLFAGEQRDFNLGLDYLRARYLSTRSGRLLSADAYPWSVRSPVSLHRLVYVGNNPVNLIDPSGRYSLTELLTTTSIESILRSISKAVIGKELFEKIDNTINAVEIAVFFGSIGLFFGLSDVLHPGFPYTVETLDHSKQFTLTNTSTTDVRKANIAFKYNDIDLHGELNFTNVQASTLNAKLLFDGENQRQYALVSNDFVSIVLILNGIGAGTGAVPLTVTADISLVGRIKPLDLQKQVDLNLGLSFGDT